MKLNQIPHIYNLDKMKVYVDNRMARELWIGQHGIQWYIQEDETLRVLGNSKVDCMGVVVEGCLSDIVVLEIFLK